MIYKNFKICVELSISNVKKYGNNIIYRPLQNLREGARRGRSRKLIEPNFGPNEPNLIFFSNKPN